MMIKEKGYIALMATIVISLILLVMAVEEGGAGFHARFNILGTEAKEQSSSLAEGCAEQALANLITDPLYEGDADIIFPDGTCHVFPIDTSLTPFVTIETQAQVRGSFTTISKKMNIHDIHLGTIPLTPPPSPDLRATLDSWKELP